MENGSPSYAVSATTTHHPKCRGPSLLLFTHHRQWFKINSQYWSLLVCILFWFCCCLFVFKLLNDSFKETVRSSLIPLLLNFIILPAILSPFKIEVFFLTIIPKCILSPFSTKPTNLFSLLYKTWAALLNYRNRCQLKSGTSVLLRKLPSKWVRATRLLTVRNLWYNSSSWILS